MDAQRFARWLFLVAALITLGCGVRRLRYDKPPSRGLLEDRWPGHYFNEVHASFTLPLHSPAASLLRDFRKPIAIVSNNPSAAKSITGTPSTPPTHATVDIDYSTGSSGPSPRTAKVTLHWLKPDEPIANGQTYVAEEREIAIGFYEIRRFLEESGRFRVDRDEPFFAKLAWEQNQSEIEPIRVKFEIRGPNKDAEVSSAYDYKNPGHLYQLVEEIWPGAR